MHWFRWYHGSTNDSKLRRIAHETNTSAANVIAVWVTLLEQASECVERGSVHRWNVEDTAFTLGIPTETVAQIYAAMQGKVLTGQQVTHWSDRQPKREKHTSAHIGTDGSISEHIGTHQDTSALIGTNGSLEERRGEESIKKTTAKSSSPKAPKPDKKYPHYPIEYCDQLYTVYKTNRGPMEYGTFRKLSAPLFPTNYALDQIIHAMEAWLEYVEGIGPEKAKWQKLPEFCASLERWVRIGAMTLADENGVTERGRLCCGIAA